MRNDICHKQTPKWKGSVNFTACLPIFFIQHTSKPLYTKFGAFRRKWISPPLFVTYLLHYKESSVLTRVITRELQLSTCTWQSLHMVGINVRCRLKMKESKWNKPTNHWHQHQITNLHQSICLTYDRDKWPMCRAECGTWGAFQKRIWALNYYSS